MITILLYIGVWGLIVYGAGYWLSTEGTAYFAAETIKYLQSGFLILASLVLWRVITKNYEASARQLIFGIIIILVLAFLLVHPMLERLLGYWLV
ncbi:MAG: hypothetical protein COT81_05925 [Candidatus Buchananbacteria bacterium CG10_big_fil_rev_8_21_14_0_10_42_9]|uniref:Uncharacterized protein n=1 Tax=Candidatus Buchananbacteria bacterium CG10_big_fil_rev_8_21_14_0_10_42_9 TaxID=1974526 RepID=A0A2H0VZL2_9BACT|nr:MAG: hypothetical protein COT81_05925 [Candidatus Buchananbacteria bacterium CG10_big_fil_rev_8_21_14_0_10_42_9]